MGLLSSVHNRIYDELSEKQEVTLYGGLMLYLFQGCKQADLRVLFQDLPFDFKSWRMNLSKEGELLFNSKVWLYSKFRLLEAIPDSKLPMEELECLMKASRFIPLKRRLRELAQREDSRSLSLRTYSRLLTQLFESQDLKAYTNSFIRKKMSFLIASYGLTRQDILSDLYASALFSVYKSYPRFENFGHVLAIAKTSIHNRGINLIKERTREKNNHLLQNSDGSYRATHVPLDVLGHTGGDSELTLSFLVSGVDGSTNSSWEQNRSISELLDSDVLNPNQQRMLNLLLGREDSEFSDFLGKDNAEAAYAWSYSVYFKHVCQFLNISAESGTIFLQSLRSQL